MKKLSLTYFPERVVALRSRFISSQSEMMAQSDTVGGYHLFEIRPHENNRLRSVRIFYHNPLLTDVLVVPFDSPANAFNTLKTYLDREVDAGFKLIPSFAERYSLGGNSIYLYNGYGSHRRPAHVQLFDSFASKISDDLREQSGGFKSIGEDRHGREAFRKFDEDLKGVWVSHNTPRYGRGEILNSPNYTATTFIGIGMTLRDLEHKVRVQPKRQLDGEIYFYEADGLFNVGVHQTAWERIDAQTEA